MPDSTGFGSYQESGTVIPCELDGQLINYTAQMFLDCEPPIAAGREIWGFPKKYGKPDCRVEGDTIVGELSYSGQVSATGTMSYKYEEIPEAEAIKSLTKPSCNLKIIPDVDFSPKVCQLVGYQLRDVKFKGAWSGPARLNLIAHANSPTADLPIRRIIGGKHFLADIVLPYGEVLYDYMLNKDKKEDEVDAKVFTEQKVRSIPSMPAMSPSYSRGPHELGERQHLSVKYITNEDAIRRWVPDHLVVNDENVVIAQWTSTFGNHGLGTYSKVDWMIPVADQKGNKFLFQLASFLNSSAPTTLGREVYGQPQKHAQPSLSVHLDTLNGTLKYSGLDVAMATMPFKQHELDADEALHFLATPRLTIKLVPDVLGGPQIAQLVSLRSRHIKINTAYQGRARLHLQAHANAPVSDLPVEAIHSAFHITCSETLGDGFVEHDYLAAKRA